MLHDKALRQYTHKIADSTEIGSRKIKPRADDLVGLGAPVREYEEALQAICR